MTVIEAEVPAEQRQQLTARLSQAQAELAELHRRIAAGEEVSGADLSHATTEVEIAQRALAGAEAAAADRAEQARQERIAELEEALDGADGRIQSGSRAVLRKVRATEATLTEIHETLSQLSSERHRIMIELARLRGHRYTDPRDARLPTKVVAEILARVLQRRGEGQSVSRELDQLARGGAGEYHAIAQLEHGGVE